MSRVFSTRAIVIKNYKIGEADRLLLAFTEKLGKILVIAKAARRLESKLAGHIELYRPTQLELTVSQSQYYRLTGAQIFDSQPDFKLSIEVIRHLEMLGETIDLALGEAEANPSAFKILLAAIIAIHEQPDNYLRIATEGMVKLLEKLGFRPELWFCTICRRQLTDDQNGWSSASGGVVCRFCLATKADVKLIKNNKTLVLLRLMQSERNIAGRLVFSPSLIVEAVQLLKDYLLIHLPRPLKSFML